MIFFVRIYLDLFFLSLSLIQAVWANRALGYCATSIDWHIFTNWLHDMFQSPYGSFGATGTVPCTAYSSVRSAIGVAATDDHSVSVTDSFPCISYFHFDCLSDFTLNMK